MCYRLYCVRKKWLTDSDEDILLVNFGYGSIHFLVLNCWQIVD